MRRLHTTAHPSGCPCRAETHGERARSNAAHRCRRPIDASKGARTRGSASSPPCARAAAERRRPLPSKRPPRRLRRRRAWPCRFARPQRPPARPESPTDRSHAHARTHTHVRTHTNARTRTHAYSRAHIHAHTHGACNTCLELASIRRLVVAAVEERPACAIERSRAAQLTSLQAIRAIDPPAQKWQSPALVDAAALPTAEPKDRPSPERERVADGARRYAGMARRR